MISHKKVFQWLVLITISTNTFIKSTKDSKAAILSYTTNQKNSSTRSLETLKPLTIPSDINTPDQEYNITIQDGHRIKFNNNINPYLININSNLNPNIIIAQDELSVNYIIGNKANISFGQKSKFLLTDFNEYKYTINTINFNNTESKLILSNATNKFNLNSLSERVFVKSEKATLEIEGKSEINKPFIADIDILVSKSKLPSSSSELIVQSPLITKSTNNYRDIILDQSSNLLISNTSVYANIIGKGNNNIIVSGRENEIYFKHLGQLDNPLKVKVDGSLILDSKTNTDNNITNIHANFIASDINDNIRFIGGGDDDNRSKIYEITQPIGEVLNPFSTISLIGNNTELQITKGIYTNNLVLASSLYSIQNTISLMFENNLIKNITTTNYGTGKINITKSNKLNEIIIGDREKPIHSIELTSESTTTPVILHIGSSLADVSNYNKTLAEIYTTSGIIFNNLEDMLILNGKTRIYSNIIAKNPAIGTVKISPHATLRINKDIGSSNNPIKAIIIDEFANFIIDQQNNTPVAYTSIYTSEGIFLDKNAKSLTILTPTEIESRFSGNGIINIHNYATLTNSSTYNSLVQTINLNANKDQTKYLVEIIDSGENSALASKEINFNSDVRLLIGNTTKNTEKGKILTDLIILNNKTAEIETTFKELDINSSIQTKKANSVLTFSHTNRSEGKIFLNKNIGSSSHPLKELKSYSDQEFIISKPNTKIYADFTTNIAKTSQVTIKGTENLVHSIGSQDLYFRKLLIDQNAKNTQMLGSIYAKEIEVKSQHPVTFTKSVNVDKIVISNQDAYVNFKDRANIKNIILRDNVKNGSGKIILSGPEKITGNIGMKGQNINSIELRPASKNSKVITKVSGIVYANNYYLKPGSNIHLKDDYIIKTQNNGLGRVNVNMASINLNNKHLVIQSDNITLGKGNTISLDYHVDKNGIPVPNLCGRLSINCASLTIPNDTSITIKVNCKNPELCNNNSILKPIDTDNKQLLNSLVIKDDKVHWVKTNEGVWQFQKLKNLENIDVRDNGNNSENNLITPSSINNSMSLSTDQNVENLPTTDENLTTANSNIDSHLEHSSTSSTDKYFPAEPPIIPDSTAKNVQEDFLKL